MENRPEPCAVPFCHGSETGLTRTKLALDSAEMSSTRGAFEALNCIDGILTRQRDTVDSMCHTESPYKVLKRRRNIYKPAPWLYVELAEEAYIHGVILFTRADCCGARTRNVEVRVGKPNTIFANGECNSFYSIPACLFCLSLFSF